MVRRVVGYSWRGLGTPECARVHGLSAPRGRRRRNDWWAGGSRNWQRKKFGAE